MLVRSASDTARRALLGMLALLFAPLVLVSLTAAPAHACTCKTGNFATLLDEADLVMVGTVERVVPASEVPTPTGTPTPSPTSSPTSTPSGGVGTDSTGTETLQVVATRVFKGTLEQSRTRVSSANGGSCRWFDPTSDERLLFVVRDGQASLCSGSRPATGTVMAKVRKTLGSGERMPAPPPAVAVRTKVEETAPREFTRMAAPGAAMVLLGLLGLAVVRGVSRH